MDLETETKFLASPDGDFIASFIKISRFEFDLKRLIFYFDQNFGPLLGQPPISTMSETDFLQLMPSGAQDFFMRQLNLVKDGQTSMLEIDVRMKAVDDTFRWVSVAARLKRTVPADANPVLEGMFVDISERRRDLSELSENERWFREVLEESPHAMYRADHRRNRFDYISKGFAQALGYAHEELLNMPYTGFIQHIHPDDMAAIRNDINRLFAEQKGKRFTYYCEFRFKRKDGSYVWLDDTFTFVPGPEGQYSYQVGFGSVIEKRKSLEMQLHQANEKLEERVASRTSELRQANERRLDLIATRRELELKLLEISERERRFIGRELHDGLCQQIVGVQCMFEALRHRLAAHSAVETSELMLIRDLMQDAVLQIRTLSRGLCPLSLAPKAVGAALTTLAAQTSLLYKIDCRYEGPKDASIGNPDAALHVYRIAQEAVQNAIRHGHANAIQIKLTDLKNHLHVDVENDGLPIDTGKTDDHVVKQREPGSGLGLKLIDYRVGLLGGSWKIGNHEGKVRLSLDTPVNERCFSEQ